MLVISCQPRPRQRCDHGTCYSSDGLRAPIAVSGARTCLANFSWNNLVSRRATDVKICQFRKVAHSTFRVLAISEQRALLCNVKFWGHVIVVWKILWCSRWCSAVGSDTTWHTTGLILITLLASKSKSKELFPLLCFRSLILSEK